MSDPEGWGGGISWGVLFLFGLSAMIGPPLPPGTDEWIMSARAYVGIIAFGGGSIGILLSLPSVKKFLSRREGTPLLEEPPYEKWESEEAAFREDADEVWDIMVTKFEQHGFRGQGSSRNRLQDVVRGAPWPDSMNSRDDSGVILLEVALTDFCNAVCTDAGQQVFDSTERYLEFNRARRRITESIREWESRKDDGGFIEWLRGKLDWPRRGLSTPAPYHGNTFKLQWYLELAVARATRNETAYYDYIPRLRDALSSPLTYKTIVDEHGYGGLVPDD